MGSVDCSNDKTLLLTVSIFRRIVNKKCHIFLKLCELSTKNFFQLKTAITLDN